MLYLILMAVFITSFSIASLVRLWKGDSKESVPFAVFAYRQFSLWSLLWFFFFPASTASTDERKTALTHKEIAYSLFNAP